MVRPNALILGLRRTRVRELMTARADSRHTCRPGIVAGRNLTRFTMHDITLRDSPRFVICTHGLNGATFTNVTIDSAGERNTDGFHIQGRDVYIGQSSVTNDDDCVPISGDSSNITVEDLECRSGNGLVPIVWYVQDPPHRIAGLNRSDGFALAQGASPRVDRGRDG